MPQYRGNDARRGIGFEVLDDLGTDHQIDLPVQEQWLPEVVLEIGIVAYGDVESVHTDRVANSHAWNIRR